MADRELNLHHQNMVPLQISNNPMKSITGLLLCAMVFLCCRAFANTTTAASGNLADVQSAVNSANPGDTVVVPSGNYSWNGGLTITKSLVLQGTGINSTFISRSPPISYSAELVTIQPSGDVPIRVTGINFNSSSIGQSYNRLP